MESFWYMFWKFSASDKIYHLHPAHDIARKRDMESVYPQRPLSQEVYTTIHLIIINNKLTKLYDMYCTVLRTWHFKTQFSNLRFWYFVDPI